MQFPPFIWANIRNLTCYGVLLSESKAAQMGLLERLNSGSSKGCRDHLVGHYIAATYLAHLASHLCECVLVYSHHTVFTVQKGGPFLWILCNFLKNFQNISHSSTPLSWAALWPNKPRLLLCGEKTEMLHLFDEIWKRLKLAFFTFTLVPPL